MSPSLPSPLWLALHLPPARSEQLETLACWAGGFTPRVSLAPPAGLLLEVGGCLRLWGGLPRLVEEVAAGLEAQGHAAAIAAAPAPQAALWLAGAGQSAPPMLCADVAAMCARLDALPLAALDFPAAARDQLERFGARTLADARRLPRDGLARRIGTGPVFAIARAYGELPDPRPDFAFPDQFARQIELPAPVEAAAALLFAARRLTAALAGWLAVRQAGIGECVLELAHSAREATHLVLRFAEATRDAERFERVLRERLEHLRLTAPVAALRLRADAVEALPGNSGTLFGGAAAARTAMAALAERLRARLGEESVFGIAPHADHRPECATRKVPPLASTKLRCASDGDGDADCRRRVIGAGEMERPAWGTATIPAAAAIAPLPRPFWLLRRPEALAEVDGRPWRRGALHLLGGPERIESGWWQAGEASGANEVFSDVRRDYFVALTADSRWAWVFRELRAPGGWYLHGWFA